MKILTAVVVVAAVLLIAHHRVAWGWGPSPEPGFWGTGVGNGGCYHQGAYRNGYYAGIQDAIYDHENNLVYTDQPSCLSCHSQLYLDDFRHGYDQQWNSYQYQNQESTQGTSINIYGNNNYVNTAQNNEKSQQGPGLEANPNSDFNPAGCCPNC